MKGLAILVLVLLAGVAVVGYVIGPDTEAMARFDAQKAQAQAQSAQYRAEEAQAQAIIAQSRATVDLVTELDRAHLIVVVLIISMGLASLGMVVGAVVYMVRGQR